MDTVTDAFAIAPEDLAARLGRADTPLILDVRRQPAFDASAWLLPASEHCPIEALESWLRSRRPGTVVTSCAHGHGVGRRAATRLRAAGWSARWLIGGVDGGEDGVDDPVDVLRWRSAPLPRLRKRPDLGVAGARGSRWVTREHPKVDRVACPWLLRRFVDRSAVVHYVPAAQVEAQALRLGAVPFDTDGAPIGHVQDACSFDALLRAFDLDTPALRRLAAIVRGADTGRLDLAPEAPGLLAVSHGLSRELEDDHALLAAALPLYDALHAWCGGGGLDPQGSSPARAAA